MSNIKVRVIDCHIARYNNNKSDWEFLLLKRNMNTLYPGTWQGVTGKIELSEIPYKTALRELMEETGLVAYRLFTVDKVNTFYDANRDTMNLIPVFGAIVKSNDVKLSNEHTEFKWCNVNETKRFITWDQQKKGVQIFYDMLTNDDNRLKLMEIQINE
tara:strand:- start:8893 stop:9366 length:474 start_codon:yes stop_codon:yes gene_type:complete